MFIDIMQKLAYGLLFWLYVAIWVIVLAACCYMGYCFGCMLLYGLLFWLHVTCYHAGYYFGCVVILILHIPKLYICVHDRHLKIC